MKVDFTDDEAFAAAVERGVQKAMESTAVLEALAARISLKLVYLTYEEARRVVGCKESKWDRWIKDHRKPGTDGCPAVKISTALGGTEPRVHLGSLLAVMEFHTPAEPVPLNGAQLLS